MENLPIDPVGYKIVNGPPDTQNPIKRSGLTADPGYSSTSSSTGSALTGRAVIGPDDREQVQDTTAPAYRRIGQINFKQGSGSYICTGWLISARSVVTAGHCLDGRVSDITFSPARNGGSNPYGTYRATEIWVDGRGVNASGGDWGLITLDQPVGDTVGWYGLAPRQVNEFVGNDATVVGYPGDKPRGTMWQGTDAVTGANARIFSYRTDTYGGQSGPAVTIANPNTSNGIHIWGGSSSNSATRITGELFSTLAQLRS
ncbi:trypsin-like serine protease [Acaricomes phytoseiuli]|uniref:trypsin-like serine peptidase n=1 Tax=Acaricomes phytoseiuli TaxID=291968 RepID=UPI00037E9D99|nr:trypsin-like serine protease [Acaricomes phytoseiuli]MCW1248615.1 trypsin-like serine protease [Acaricomes phytoseiuli]